MTLLRRAASLALTAGVVGACSSCADAGAPANVSLRLHYEVGETLQYRYHVEGTVTQPDTSDGTPTHESYERTMTVDEVASEVTPRGNYLLTWTYHLGPRPEDEGRRAMPDEFALRVEITPQGKIMEVSDLRAARAAFGNLDFKTYLDQTQPVFPDRPLKVGDSWTQEVRVLSPQAEPVVTRSTYVLEALDDRSAVIAFDGDVYLPGVYEADSRTDKPPHTTEERIRVRGKLHFDHGHGIVRRVETTAQATVTKVTMGPEGPRRRNVDMTQRSELTLVEP